MTARPEQLDIHITYESGWTFSRYPRSAGKVLEVLSAIVEKACEFAIRRATIVYFVFNVTTDGLRTSFPPYIRMVSNV